MKPAVCALAGALLMASSPAVAADDELELWFSPSLTMAIDDKYYLELDTAQRFRDKPAADTYQHRLWFGRKLAKRVSGAVGIERTFEGDRRETRILQQLNYPLGSFSARTRLEQRFVSDAARTAWRVRQRVGYAVPLSGDGKSWKLTASIEGFFTLRAGSAGGTTGLTGLRSVIGVERDWPKVKLGLGYVRNQAVRKNAPDRVGHAPLIALGFKL